MMGRMQRTKGAVGEREAAAEWNRHFGTSLNRRCMQSRGGKNDGADLQGQEGLHIEVKRCESLSVYKAMGQAKADKKGDDLPVVLHRRNKEDWLVIVQLDDLPQFVSTMYLTLAAKDTPIGE